MTAIARLRRQRQRERRATFRDYDVVWTSLFVGLPVFAVLAAILGYVLGSLPLRIVQKWRGLTFTFTLEWAQERQVRQMVPAAFYRAFEGER